MTLTPAYGRDYRSKALLLEDFQANKDFVAQPEGRYVNRGDLLAMGVKQVTMRYGKLRKVTIVQL